MDRISVRGMRFMARHGANPGEQDREQPFDAEVILDVDLARAATSDEVGDTVNYADIYRAVREEIQGEPCALLERLADRTIARLLTDPRIAGVQLTIAKPGLLDGATAAVTLVRRRTPAPARER